MAIKRHDISWVGVYRSDVDTYYGGVSPIMAGSGNGFNSYLGINSVAVLNNIATSKTPAKVWLNLYVTSGGVFALGMHKETTNKASGTKPYYAYTGRRFTPSPGWRRYDITDFTRAVGGYGTFRSALTGGFHGMVLYGQIGEPDTRATGSVGATRAFLEVEGQWNTPPGTSTFISPVTGATFDESVTVSWTQATDAEQSASQLSYEISYHNGLDWVETWVLKNQLTYNYPLWGQRESGTARFRIRVFDGESYSAYSYTGYFNVNHNSPPSIPTLISPVGGVAVDRNTPVTFSWKHNDDGVQSKFTLGYKLRGTPTWSTITKTTSRTTETLTAGTLPLGVIEWQVQTYDQGDLESPWSYLGLFNSTEAGDAPEIAFPVLGEFISTADFRVNWTSAEQSQYEVQLLKSGVLFLDWAGSDNTKIISENGILNNETSYTVKVRIKTNAGLWSAWSERNFYTSFTSPQDPQVTIRIDDTNSALLVEVFNPMAIENEPLVIKNTVERKRVDEDWIRLSNDVANSGVFIDYTPASGVVYEYRVTAIGANDTMSEPTIAIGSINLKYAVLSLSNNPGVQLVLNRIIDRSSSIGVNSSLMEFTGRRLPVSEFGETIQRDLVIKCLVYQDDYIKLLDMIDKQETLLYRDARGRKVYAIVPSLSIADEHLDRYTIDIPFNEVHFREGID